jgi:hypothetical protein
MPARYAPGLFVPTPYILAAFFALVIIALVGAKAFSQEQAVHAAQAAAADAYVPDDENGPVTDAVPEKS